MPGHSTDDDGAAPAPKRVRREYPWRPEFARDLGVRPIQVNAVSGEALLVECRFCVSFGREPPAPPVAPPVNKDGQPVKTRARTRNVAHWKYPFRTDNMRSHHLQQHSHKWAEYSGLLELAKQEDAAGGRPADDETSATHKLNTFFGETQEPGAVVAMMSARPNGSFKATVPASVESPGLLESKRGDHAYLLPSISNGAIADFVLSTLVDIPTGDVKLNDSGRTAEPWLARVEATGTSDSSEEIAVEYAIDGRDKSVYQGVASLFEAGLSFAAVANVINTNRRMGSNLDRQDIVGYAQALVASNLQRIAQLMEKSWTYSLRLLVHPPSGERLPASLRLSVRVPVDGYRNEDEFHIVTVALHQSMSASEHVENLFHSVLLALDRNFAQKVLSVSSVGAVQYLGVHAGLPDHLKKELEGSVIHVMDGRHAVEDAVQSAWLSYLDQPISDPKWCFIDVLLHQVERIRGDNDAIGRLGHCPIITRTDVNTIFRAVKWFLIRRDVMIKSEIHIPDWWWIVAHVVADVWTDCLVTTASKLSEGCRLETQGKRVIVEQLTKSLKAKCAISAESIAGDGFEIGFLFDDDARLATIFVREESEAHQMTWTSKDIAACLRSLNVSTRRLFGELVKDFDAVLAIEREISCIVLNVVSRLDCSKPEEVDCPPPTLPLDFARYDPSEIVDFVEMHSRRLEFVFPTAFLDLVSREIRDLQALLSTSEDLRRELDQATRQSPGREDCFADAWSLVPQFPAARTVAAGLATSLPRQLPAYHAVQFGRVEGDQMPPNAAADLAVEARAQACQVERLQKAFEPPQDETSLVV